MENLGWGVSSTPTGEDNTASWHSTRVFSRQRILPAANQQRFCSIPDSTIDVRMHLPTDACRQSTYFVKILSAGVLTVSNVQQSLSL